MSNVIERVFVHTRDGRSFEMDDFNPSTYRGTSRDEYSNRIETRIYHFVTGHVIGYEFVTIEKKDEPSHKWKWHKCSDDCKEELNLAAFESDYQEDNKDIKKND